jgi:hypothetical protein
MLIAPTGVVPDSVITGLRAAPGITSVIQLQS